MSGVDSQSSADQMREQSTSASGEPTDMPPHGEHEVVDARADQDEPAPETVSPQENVPDEDIGATNDTLPIVDAQLDDTSDTDIGDMPVEVKAKAPPDSRVTATIKTKPSMSVKSPVGKSNGGPTHLVKRVINSGTFGAGSLKPGSSKPAAIAGPAPTKPSSTAPVLRKSTSLTPASPSKPSPMASSRLPSAPPSRRLSVAPSKPPAPPPAKPVLSASASAKPSSSAGATRASVVSPAGSTASSTARPRASVTEGVKRGPPASRQSLSISTKYPTTSAKPSTARLPGAPVKAARATGSISSIREINEDGKASEDLQVKLKQAIESIALKSEIITDLESQIEALKSSLESALANVDLKDNSTEQLELQKSLLETQLAETKEVLSSLQLEHHSDHSVSEALQQDLEAAKISANTQAELVQNLRSQIQALEIESSSVKENLEALKASTISKASTTALIEHEAEALKAAHAQALQETQTRLVDLEAKAAQVETLSTQVGHLTAEKEENAGKISELEIEILELKESQEALEEERDLSLARVKDLQKELSESVAETQQAIEDADAKGADHTAQLEETKNLHNKARETWSREQADLVAALEALKAELASALATTEEAKNNAVAAREETIRSLEEVERASVIKETELREEIKRITAELEGQEAYYNSKVDAVKDEHDRLLQEAFERAKNEAGEQHAQELQALATSSGATVEQIQLANQSALEELKKEHALNLDSQVKSLEKHISTLKIDLKATQDDLAKAKASLANVRAEADSLTVQRDEARAATASTPVTSLEHVEEVARLTTELSNTKDDLAAVTDMLNLTKASLAEMSNNQTKELQEAAQSRADEITKLRSAHDKEVASLAAQKSELLIKLSDLEGELATVKATIASESSAPKSNGDGAPHPPSPPVTKEELQRLHEAHNLKIYDLEAEHQKAIQVLKDDLEAFETQITKLKDEVGHKELEIKYLEADQEEHQDQITRLKGDLDSLTEQRSKEQAVSA